MVYNEMVKKLLEGKSLIEQRRICRAMGVEFKMPKVEAQILGKGNVEKLNRGRALNSTQYLVVPEVYLDNGKTIPRLVVDIRTARTAATEILRLCNEHKF